MTSVRDGNLAFLIFLIYFLFNYSDQDWISFPKYQSQKILKKIASCRSPSSSLLFRMIITITIFIITGCYFIITAFYFIIASAWLLEIFLFYCNVAHIIQQPKTYQADTLNSVWCLIYSSMDFQSKLLFISIVGRDCLSFFCCCSAFSRIAPTSIMTNNSKKDSASLCFLAPPPPLPPLQHF